MRHLRQAEKMPLEVVLAYVVHCSAFVELILNRYQPVM